MPACLDPTPAPSDAHLSPLRLSPARQVAVAALICASVSACAGTPPVTPAAAPLSPTTASAPLPVEGYDWFYDDDPVETRLAYGLEASDDLRLGLSCRPGSGALDLIATGPEGAKEIHLESGGETERFPAAAEPSELHDGVLLTATGARTDAPVFQRFRKVGWMALWQGDDRQPYAPHPATVPDIERFFTRCG